MYTAAKYGPFAWTIVVGEYPPQAGGVADYTWTMAHALGRAGDDVHVFAPPCGQPDPAGPVTVHRLPDVYGPRSLIALARALKSLPQPRTTLVQYVPQSFGLRGCNVLFAAWLGTLRVRPWVIFHEVQVSAAPGDPLRLRVLALVTQWMARRVARAAGATFVSTTAWEPLIRRHVVKQGEIECTPVPSAIALTSTPDRTQEIRECYAGKDGALIGHFGTYRMAYTRAALKAAVPGLLAVPDRAVLFLGANSDGFAEELATMYPQHRSRIHGTGELDPQSAADHLAACTLAIQPFPDGVTTRRGSVTAALALGVPVVTNAGLNTEPLWRESGGVLLFADVSELAGAVEQLLGDPLERKNVGQRGAALYKEHLSIEHSIRTLRQGRSTGSGASD
jgi:glycosyltransferase involved in cell wall biosynthesis